MGAARGGDRARAGAECRAEEGYGVKRGETEDTRAGGSAWAAEDMPGGGPMSAGG
jgi:hypothetical protein